MKVANIKGVLRKLDKEVRDEQVMEWNIETFLREFSEMSSGR